MSVPESSCCFCFSRSNTTHTPSKRTSKLKLQRKGGKPIQKNSRNIEEDMGGYDKSAHLMQTNGTIDAHSGMGGPGGINHSMMKSGLSGTRLYIDSR